MSILNIPQQEIYVDVSFYDDVEKQKLLKYPTAANMQQMVSSPIAIPTPEFLTYYLFHRKKLGSPGYSSYDSIGRKIGQSLSHLEGCIEFNGSSICTANNVESQLLEISEHVGEAIGLSVASRIHGLNEADWEQIPGKGGRGSLPFFDFQIASDGKKFVQVENKGSSVVDNHVHDGNVKAQYRRIIDKKQKLNALSNGKIDPFPASLRYGTITAVDPRRNGNVRCWLTDPPPDQVEQDPAHYQLVWRMRFISNWIGFISPRSQLATALATRVADMEAMDNPAELNGIPLRQGNGEPIKIDTSFLPNGQSTYFISKSHITDGPAGGVVVQTSKSELMLLGVRSSLISMATGQDFDTIRSFKEETGTLQKSVKCIFSKTRYQSLHLPASIHEIAKESNGYYSFELSGYIQYNAAGLVFGRLELPEE